MTNRETPLLCREVGVAVAGRCLVDALSFSLKAGEVLAILGQNGCGKSLTLNTLAGLRSPSGGEIALYGETLTAMDRRSIARRMALLPQSADDLFPASVEETVLIGRHPHIDAFSWESADDIAAARQALATVDLADFTSRDVMTLSGGERRRLAIAQVLAQSPDVYLLDEPTNHLDPQHQIDTLQLFRTLADRDSVSIIACLHDVNLAVRFADRCLLLFGDGSWHLGETKTTLNAQRLSRLYGTSMEALAWREHTIYIASGDEAA